MIRFLQLVTIVFVATFTLWVNSSNSAYGQNLRGDDLFLDGGGSNPEIYFIKNGFAPRIRMSSDPFSNFSSLSFELQKDAGGSYLPRFHLENKAPPLAAGVYGNGFAIGTVLPNAPLHIHSSDTMGYPEAKIFIQNRSSTTSSRELIRLENNGGISIRMLDNWENTFFKMENVNDSFEIASGPVHFRIDNDSTDNALNLAGTGIGIGTRSPESTLHILADGVSSDFTSATIRGEVTNDLPAMDRVMLDLRNNGAIVMNMLDTSVTGAMPYQVRTANDRLSFQQFGGNRAGLAIFGDGAVRFVANGVPNLTVTSNGNLNVIGQSGGGNLNVLGPAGGAGNLFVKGNIRYNGTLSGPSDRNIKENFQEIDPQQILKKVANLPITKWNYIADEKDTPHLGPMAQDFYSAFGLGDDQKRIPLMDNGGVALAAIKGLNQVVEAKEKKIVELNQALQDQSQALQDQNELILELSERMERLELMINPPQE